MLKRDKLYYLASPYTHKDKLVELHRLKDISIIGGKLTKLKIHCIHPIAGSAQLASELRLDTSFSFWEESDLLYISRCDGIIIADLEGWKESKGVKAEIHAAAELGLPIYILKSDLLIEKDVLELRTMEVEYKNDSA